MMRVQGLMMMGQVFTRDGTIELEASVGSYYLTRVQYFIHKTVLSLFKKSVVLIIFSFLARRVSLNYRV